MLGVQHHAISPPASKLNGITILSPSSTAAKLQTSPPLKNNSLKKNQIATLDFETSTPDIATAWPGLPQDEGDEGDEKRDGVRRLEKEKKSGPGGDLTGTANGVNGDAGAVVDGDDGFADASRNLELNMAAIDAQLVQGYGSDSAQPTASTIDSAHDGPPESTVNDEEQTIEAPESEATSPITPLEDIISKPRKSSSPLSDLSPVPTHDDDEIKDEGADIVEIPSNNSAESPAPDNHASLKPPENISSQSSSGPSFSPLPPSSPQLSSSSQLLALPDPSPSQTVPFPSLRSIPTNAIAGPSNIKQLNGITPSFSKGDADQKVEMILELNAELFRICLAFQTNGIAMGAPEAQPFSKKLSSNLTWLAAHVDNSSKALEVEIPLPEMDPPILQPTTIPLPDVERIMSIYSQLPKLFAKDINRRERKVAQQRASATPSASSGPLPQVNRSATPLSRAHSVSSASTAPPSSAGVKRERDGADRESPNSQKRQNTGDGRVRTPGPGPSPGPGTMLPPAVPEMSSANLMSHQQLQQRPGSAMGMNMGNMNMNIGMVASPGSMMMSRSSSSGSMQSGLSNSMSGMPSGSRSPVNMQNMPGMPIVQGSDPQAIMRARQMQMRQAQLQQQQQQMQQSQMGMQGQQMTPQMQNAHQMQQQQQAALSARQMSPSHGTSGIPGRMGGGSMPQQVSLGMQSPPGDMPNTQAGVNQVTPQMLQQIQALGPAAVQGFQALQNPQNPFVKYLRESIPGFDQLPLPQQLQKMQQMQVVMQRRNQANAANTMMSNQMRNPGMMASSSGQPNMSQHSGQGSLPGMGGVNMGMGEQMQPSTSDGAGGMFRNDQGMGNRGMPNNSGMGMMNPSAGGANSNAMQMQMQQFANLNPQQRQLYLMQMQQQQQQQSQMRGAAAGAGGMPGGGMNIQSAGGLGAGGMPNNNPGMMNPSMNMNQQMLAQQRLMAQRQGSQGSSLNSGAAAGPSSAGVDLSHQQYPPGLRSNPGAAMPGIARSTSARSPSMSEMGGGTPRLGGRMLPGQAAQNDEYHRALMQAQAQRSQMQQQQQQQQQNFMHGAGGHGQMAGQGQWANQAGMAYGAGQGMPSPNTAGNWQQQGVQQGYPMVGSPGHQPEHPGTPRQASSTPAPMIHHSPTSQPTEFDSMMNW